MSDTTDLGLVITDLRARIARALIATPAAGVVAAGYDIDQPWMRHGAGHGYHACCALCTGDVDALLEAVLAAVNDEAIDRMAEHYVNDTHIRSMEFRNGVEMKLRPAQDMVALWVAAAKTMLGDAENYSETEARLPSVSMDVKLAGEFEMFTLTVQRAQKPTPHELRQQFERERDEALAEVERLRSLYESPKPRHACPACGGSVLVGKLGRLRRHKNPESRNLCEGSEVEVRDV